MTNSEAITILGVIKSMAIKDDCEDAKEDIVKIIKHLQETNTEPMTDDDYKEYDVRARNGSIPDSENPIFLFSMTSRKLVCSIVSGELDARDLTRRELEL